MPEKPNNFWQELKRRKVIRVITVYAGAAFVIIELTNNITEPLSLPEWVPTLVIVLLAIGFLISIVMSWVYDITPEGVQKTKSLRKSQKGDNISGSKGWKIATYLSIAVIIALLSINILGKKRNTQEFAELEKSIAVLQFENLGSDEEQEWFSEGITDIIINQLSKITEFRILGRTSTLKYKSGEKTISEIGQELNVNLVIEGTVQRVSDKVRISVQLVRVLNEDHLWSEVYDREWKDIFSIQNDIAVNIARELKTTLSVDEKEKIEKISTQSSEAYDLYLQGRYYWNMRDEDGIKKSIALFDKAIGIDSSFALAYAGLADAYSISADWNYIEYDSAVNMSIGNALIAILLDNSLAEPYATIGTIANDIFKNPYLEDLCFNRAHINNANYSSAYQWQALILTRRGKFNEAVEHIEKALVLDPKSLIINYAAGLIYYYKRDYDKALAQLTKTQALDTEFSITNTYSKQKILCYLQLEKYNDILIEYKNMIDDDELLNEYNNKADEIFEKHGKTGLIEYILSIEKNSSGSSFELIAALLSHINKKEEALDIIEEMINKKLTHWEYIHIEPAFDTLHTEKRFIELSGRINVEAN